MTNNGDPASVHIVAPMLGTVVSTEVAAGARVPVGALLVVLESMKLEHEVRADASGIVATVLVAPGDTVAEGQVLVHITAAAIVDDAAPQAGGATDLDHLRPDLAESIERHAIGLDPRRPDVVARRHARGRRTARENLDDLVDAGTFVEYGPLMVAAQRRRRSERDLIERTPADGLVGGIASVNGDRFPGGRTQCTVLSYDYTVLAGTQGHHNHRKKDRLFEVTERLRTPVVFFAEGGGGRPGDTDATGVAALDCMAFALFARLSGLVPIVGITGGFCFAGNAAILGCCDVVIALEGSNIGMGGPAMIEGGGLGVFAPEQVGPLDVQRRNGVVDLVAADDADAVRLAKQYLAYFQGPTNEWACADQRLLRNAIPENRMRGYDTRAVVDLLFDTGSVLELRRDFGVGMITALARLEGRPVGVLANNPSHLAGAIDSDGADKAARFLQLCDAHDLPVVTLVDTPGMMVGPDVETTALVRHCCRLFVTGANLDVPIVSVVLRKAYGLGAQAMVGGSMKAPLLTVAWPSAEFGGMGLEGAVRLGYRRELEAITDADERERVFAQRVAHMYEIGKAVSTASHFEIDDVIDPAETRGLLTRLLAAAPPPERRSGKKRAFVDTW